MELELFDGVESETPHHDHPTAKIVFVELTSKARQILLPPCLSAGIVMSQPESTDEKVYLPL